MKIIIINTTYLRTNTYIVYDEKMMRGFVIDPGGNAEGILRAAEERGITLEAQLLTHGHFDHIGAVAELQDRGIKAYIHAKESAKLADGDRYGVRYTEADFTVEDGDVIVAAGFKIEVLHTPGHTSGGVCYLTEGALFSGDTLFFEGVGKTDLSDGDYEALQASLEKIFALGDYVVFPGHGQSTTLEHERKYFFN